MRKILFLILSLTILSLSFSCKKEKLRPSSEGRVLVVYITGNNSLSAYADLNLEGMMQGYLPDHDSADRLLVFFHNRVVTPVLYDIYLDASGEPVKSEITHFDMKVSASAEAVGTVLNFVKGKYPSKHYGLIMWSHSTGWLPEGYFTSGPPKGSGAVPSSAPEVTDHRDIFGDAVVKLAINDGASPLSFGQDELTKQEIDIRDLADVMPMHFDYIFFDSCLMGGIEVAYEFREVTDYMGFSQTEILANGFPYSEMMYPFFNYDIEKALSEAARIYVEYYSSSQWPYATFSVVDCRKLEPLASACAKIYSQNRDKVADLNMASIQGYFRMNKHWFYDLGSFVKALNPGNELTGEFNAALNDIFIFKEATEDFLTIKIFDYSGFSTYIQNPSEPYLDSYYMTLDWNKATQMVVE